MYIIVCLDLKVSNEFKRTIRTLNWCFNTYFIFSNLWGYGDSNTGNETLEEFLCSFASRIDNKKEFKMKLASKENKWNQFLENMTLEEFLKKS